MSQEKTLREKVFSICDIMQDSGEKITRASVRERTGGSDRDLSKFINEWRESKALVVQSDTESSLDSGTNSSNNDVDELNTGAYSTTPTDDLARIARRGAERAAALMVGEDAVVAHLLENPDQLPEDLRQQVEGYKSRTIAAANKRQEQYNPDFFAQMAIAQFK
ncbi:DNA-binding protein [Nostoc sp. 2RC]|uniref:DNA-binding protein n=1 Tax=Nostoc sp. 2RC TaxID=2485484 RepID=UPI001626713D|nr:DNA-binding protein [Nostoc sp. 2RC]MBC1237582.1 DNA-binding protein [Nostoc sp. 2RC]